MAYIINRSPALVIEFKTLNKVWLGDPSNYANLQVFGCPTYYHVKEEKLEPRSRKVILVGCMYGVKRMNFGIFLYSNL